MLVKVFGCRDSGSEFALIVLRSKCYSVVLGGPFDLVSRVSKVGYGG